MKSKIRSSYCLLALLGTIVLTATAAQAQVLNEVYDSWDYLNSPSNDANNFGYPVSVANGNMPVGNIGGGQDRSASFYQFDLTGVTATSVTSATLSLTSTFMTASDVGDVVQARLYSSELPLGDNNSEVWKYLTLSTVANSQSLTAVGQTITLNLTSGVDAALAAGYSTFSVLLTSNYAVNTPSATAEYTSFNSPNVTLTLTSAPEPTTLSLGLAGVVALLAWTRMRRNASVI